MNFLKKILKKTLITSLILLISFSSLFPFALNVKAEENIIGKIINNSQYLRPLPTNDTLNNPKLVSFTTGDIIIVHSMERTAPVKGCTTGFYKASYQNYTGYVCAYGVTVNNIDAYLRPWTSPEKAIVGGAIYIGGSYIAQGQFTSYLKKYNVNPNNNYGMYSHQYMTNITAPSSEAVSSYNAYAKNNFLELPFEFSIPIFNNMAGSYDRPGGNLITPERQDNITDNDFENKISSFPDSYKPFLRSLHTKHPNWVFKPLNTNVDFSYAVSVEKTVGAIQGPSSCFELTNGSPTQSGNDKGWYNPNFEATAYYMDPRNFLTDKYIFQFESLEYSDKHTEDLIQTILNNTFMSGISILDNKPYSKIFIEAGKESDVSAVYLASLARQESGVNGGAATTGNSFDYQGVQYSGLFNYYNIGATSSSEVPYKNGLKWASGGLCTICVNNNTYVPELNLTSYLSLIGVKVNNNIVKGFSVGDKIANIKAKLQNNDISVNSSSDKISTGTTFTYKNETFTVVISGDLTGDGLINSADLLKMRQYLQGSTSLSGVYLEAARLVNNNINSADLLKLRQHLLGTNPINQ